MPRAHATGPGDGGNGAAVVFMADELVLFVLFVPLPKGGDGGGGDSCIKRRLPGGAAQSLYVRVTVMAASGMP